MKTVKFIALAIFALAMLNSCTEGDSRDPYYDEEYHETWYTEILEVRAGDWKLRGGVNDIGSYYEYIFPDFPYADGIINVYMYTDFGTSSETQIPLPYTDYRVDVLGNGDEDHYSVQYSYDIAKDGTIAFKIYISNYMTEHLERLLLTEHFRVAIIY
ncbi:MAG: hypothetical protein LBF59_01830 [Prevotellaceae bacterium]|nr:hypothetical protein [Prevotellaceae bacterium]